MIVNMDTDKWNNECILTPPKLFDSLTACVAIVRVEGSA